MFEVNLNLKFTSKVFFSLCVTSQEEGNLHFNGLVKEQSESSVL